MRPPTAACSKAPSFGFNPLAEGIETAKELEFLKKELCTEVRGHLIGRPDNIESFGLLTHGAPLPDRAYARV